MKAIIGDQEPITKDRPASPAAPRFSLNPASVCFTDTASPHRTRRLTDPHCRAPAAGLGRCERGRGARCPCHRATRAKRHRRSDTGARDQQLTGLHTETPRGEPLAAEAPHLSPDAASPPLGVFPTRGHQRASPPPTPTGERGRQSRLVRGRRGGGRRRDGRPRHAAEERSRRPPPAEPTGPAEPRPGPAPLPTHTPAPITQPPPRRGAFPPRREETPADRSPPAPGPPPRAYHRGSSALRRPPVSSDRPAPWDGGRGERRGRERARPPRARSSPAGAGPGEQEAAPRALRLAAAPRPAARAMCP